MPKQPHYSSNADVHMTCTTKNRLEGTDPKYAKGCGCAEKGSAHEHKCNCGGGCGCNHNHK